ncbi:hypothetical protein DFJ73DRAFT_839785 [Zopfochytrium polystomum]|nr:hypothetical protein DFJ73DRAFT_839785 [Zopfochytrium polystomum]
MPFRTGSCTARPFAMKDSKVPSTAWISTSAHQSSLTSCSRSLRLAQSTSPSKFAAPGQLARSVHPVDFDMGFVGHAQSLRRRHSSLYIPNRMSPLRETSLSFGTSYHHRTLPSIIRPFHSISNPLRDDHSFTGFPKLMPVLRSRSWSSKALSSQSRNCEPYRQLLHFSFKQHHLTIRGNCLGKGGTAASPVAREVRRASYAKPTNVRLPEASKPTSKKKKGFRDVGSDDDFDGSSITFTAAPSIEPLRAIAFSTAENYDFARLLPVLQREYILQPYIADDVFHIRVADPMTVGGVEPEDPIAASVLTGTSSSDSSDSLQLPLPSAKNVAESASDRADDEDNAAIALYMAEEKSSGGEAFFFNNGTFVTWGVSEARIRELLALGSAVAIQPYEDVEMEWFDYLVNLKHPGGITRETIIIGDSLPAHQSKLAFSSGLARSAKLASLENLLDAHLDQHRHIPESLRTGQTPPSLSRASILRSLGNLFSLRDRVNHHAELLDPPDFCWSSARMENCFNALSRNLDVKPRIAVFNKKLDYANELAELLRTHLHEQHSLKLEWCIIILISIEIGFELVHYFGKLKGRTDEVKYDEAKSRFSRPTNKTVSEEHEERGREDLDQSGHSASG